MPRLLSPTVICLALVVVFCQLTSAALVTVPPDLQPGDTYRLVFLTAGVSNALPTDIASYNEFVSTQANQNPALTALGTTWKAIASTSSVDARDNTDTFSGPGADAKVYRGDGQLVVAEARELWSGSILSAINIGQSELQGSVFRVWTGTNPDGTKATFEVPGDGALGNDGLLVGIQGFYGATSSAFIGVDTEFKGSAARFYAISGLLTVVPEPSSVLLLGFGSFLVPYLRLRRS